MSNVKNLIHLVLDENDLEDEGIMNLAESIKTNQNLESLSVIACGFSTKAAYELVKTLVNIPCFKSLNIDGKVVSEKAEKCLRSIMRRSGKILVEMEDLDEDGEYDGFIDEIEQEQEEEEQQTQKKDVENSQDNSCIDALASDLASTNI